MVRPKTNNIKCDEHYFNTYYKESKKYLFCECGDKILNKCLIRHKKTKRHAKKLYLIENLLNIEY